MSSLSLSPSPPPPPNRVPVRAGTAVERESSVSLQPAPLDLIASQCVLGTFTVADLIQALLRAGVLDAAVSETTTAPPLAEPLSSAATLSPRALADKPDDVSSSRSSTATAAASGPAQYLRVDMPSLSATLWVGAGRTHVSTCDATSRALLRDVMRSLLVTLA